MQNVSFSSGAKSSVFAIKSDIIKSDMVDGIKLSDECLVLEDELLQMRLVSSYDNQLMYYIYEKGKDDRVGYCDLRIGHSAYLYYYGNIGYRIRQQYQGNCYAYRAVRMLLEVAKKLNMDYLIITVSPENVASIKTIEKVGADYIKTVKVPIWHPLYHSERVKRIYRLDL